MPVVIEQSATGSTMRLDGDVGISAALELWGALNKAVASGLELKVDLAGVTALDITTLQLLWAARQAAANADTKLHLAGPMPEAMERAIDLAGLESLAVNQ